MRAIRESERRAGLGNAHVIRCVCVCVIVSMCQVSTFARICTCVLCLYMNRYMYVMSYTYMYVCATSMNLTAALGPEICMWSDVCTCKYVCAMYICYVDIYAYIFTCTCVYMNGCMHVPRYFHKYRSVCFSSYR